MRAPTDISLQPVNPDAGEICRISLFMPGLPGAFVTVLAAPVTICAVSKPQRVDVGYRAFDPVWVQQVVGHELSRFRAVELVP